MRWTIAIALTLAGALPLCAQPDPDGLPLTGLPGTTHTETPVWDGQIDAVGHTGPLPIRHAMDWVRGLNGAGIAVGPRVRIDSRNYPAELFVGLVAGDAELERTWVSSVEEALRRSTAPARERFERRVGPLRVRPPELRVEATVGNQSLTLRVDSHPPRPQPSGSRARRLLAAAWAGVEVPSGPVAYYHETYGGHAWGRLTRERPSPLADALDDLFELAQSPDPNVTWVRSGPDGDELVWRRFSVETVTAGTPEATAQGAEVPEGTEIGLDLTLRRTASGYTWTLEPSVDVCCLLPEASETEDQVAAPAPRGITDVLGE